MSPRAWSGPSASTCCGSSWLPFARSSASRATGKTARTTAPSWRPWTCREATRTTIAREIDKLERTSEQSPEHGWIRTWLDTVFELPWGVRSDDRLDVTEAKAVLDADHTGLDDVKERIIEHLAVRKLRIDRAFEDAAGGGRQAG